MLKSLLSENSDLSSMRVMAFISLLFGGSIAILGLMKGSSISELSILTGVFVGSSFGGKCWQKSIESKTANTQTEDIKVVASSV